MVGKVAAQHGRRLVRRSKHAIDLENFFTYRCERWKTYTTMAQSFLSPTFAWHRPVPLVARRKTLLRRSSRVEKCTLGKFYSMVKCVSSIWLLKRSDYVEWIMLVLCSVMKTRIKYTKYLDEKQLPVDMEGGYATIASNHSLPSFPSPNNQANRERL